MRVRLHLVILAVATFGLVLLARMRWDEPTISGRPLTYWLYTWRHESNEWPETLPDVLTGMDDRCVTFLVRELGWRPSLLVSRLNYVPSRMINVEPFHDGPDYRVSAAVALGILGSRATPAISALEDLAHRHNAWESESGTAARGAAIAALVRLRHQPVETIVARMLNYGDIDANDYAYALSYLGTNASAAVPLLVKMIETSADDTVMCRAASSLRAIHSYPELTVPALMSLLTHTNHFVRWHAVCGLESFGGAARPAWNALVGCLSDPDEGVRQRATNVLQKIDPQAAGQLGIKE